MRSKTGQLRPLEDLERRFIVASQQLAREEANIQEQDIDSYQSPSLLSMGKNLIPPQRDEVDSGLLTPWGPSTPHDEAVVKRHKGLSRWPVQWRRQAKAASVESSPVRIEGRAPSLPNIPVLSPLPDFKERSFGEISPTGSLDDSERSRLHKPLPEIPLRDDSSDTDRTLINEDVSNQDLAHDGPCRLQTSDVPPRPVSPAVQRRGAVRRIPPQQRYRANSAIARRKNAASRPQVPRSQTTPPTPVVTAGLSNLRIVRKPLPQTPGAPPIPSKSESIQQPEPNFDASVRNSAMCHSPNCPINEPHLAGLYLYDNQRSAWRHPYWGISNPPSHIWQAWDNRTAKAANHQEVSDVLGFIQCHSFGRRGKSKEPATDQDYKEAKKLRGDKWVGGFF